MVFYQKKENVNPVFLECLPFLGFWLVSSFFFFQKPRAIIVVLRSKQDEVYFGQNITYREFWCDSFKESNRDLIPESYWCYTIDDNPFQVNQFEVLIGKF